MQSLKHQSRSALTCQEVESQCNGRSEGKERQDAPHPSPPEAAGWSLSPLRLQLRLIFGLRGGAQ